MMPGGFHIHDVPPGDDDAGFVPRAFPFPVILLNKARWGRGGGQGEGNRLTR